MPFNAYPSAEEALEGQKGEQPHGAPQGAPGQPPQGGKPQGQNPIVEALQTIAMYIGVLQEKNDPAATQATSLLSQLIKILSGSSAKAPGQPEQPSAPAPAPSNPMSKTVPGPANPNAGPARNMNQGNGGRAMPTVM